jgi:hypothetical protein
MKFRKKPVEVEAMRWPGFEGTDFDHWLTADDHRKVTIDYASVAEHEGAPLLIDTLEGTMTADVDDWVVRGIKGELYPVKPDIFDATYEPVEVKA